MFIVDAHLDLAYNAVCGRNIALPAAQQSPDDQGIPTVGVPDLHAGGLRLVCGTIFCEPWSAQSGRGYRTPHEAEAAAMDQWRVYLRLLKNPKLGLLTRRTDLEPPGLAEDQLGLVLLMEGADPILSPEHVRVWFEAGVRIVGLAWHRTRYAGGTGEPGPLSAEGVELVRALDAVGIIHDLSHLADDSFWQLVESSPGPIMASHSNCRAIIPSDRHLTDEMILAIAARRGVIGINFYDRFLVAPAQGQRRATLADVVRHVDHICQLVGHAQAVGLGTDMDGGFGREHMPLEIASAADVPKLADALASAGYSEPDVRGIMGENWRRFFATNLP